MARKGIPSIFRGKCWFQFSGAQERKEANKNLYQDLKTKYKGVVSLSTKQVDADIDRTFPDHPFFAETDTQDAIRNVLYTYSWHNPRIGYCQSMNFVAAMIFFHTNSEEDTFWLYVLLFSYKYLEWIPF